MSKKLNISITLLVVTILSDYMTYSDISMPESMCKIKGTSKDRINIRMPKKYIPMIKKCAIGENVSINYFIVKTLNKYITLYKRKY